MPITVPQALATLLSYFRTGETPTQDQFEELIRTAFYQYQEAVDQSLAAVATAEATAALVGPRMGKVLAHFTVRTVGDPTMDYGLGVDHVDGINPAHYKIYFTTPFSDANYIVSMSLQPVSEPDPLARIIAVHPDYVEVDTRYGYYIGGFSIMAWDPRV